MTGFDILCVPEVALEKILSYLSYDEIARNRLVSKQFNNICAGLLTKGFIQLEKKHAFIYRMAKAHLPKRPSERRSMNVVLSRYCEILQGMETRIRMLRITYMRYVDSHSVCFIPGKVLDEIKRLLGLIERRFDPPYNFNQLLEELRDLSSMAMEHFDEYILPGLVRNEIAVEIKNRPSTVENPPREDNTQRELKKIHMRNRIFQSKLNYLIAKTRRLSQKFNRQNVRVRKQSSIIKQQNVKIQWQSSRLENQEMTISEIKKKFEELQMSIVEIKSKWEQDAAVQATVLLQTPELPVEPEKKKDLDKTRSLRKYETKRPHSGVMSRRTTLENRSIINKNSRKTTEETKKKRRFRSMVDIEFWRRRCPTSRLSYSSWYKNYVRPKPTKIEIDTSQPSTSQEENLSKKSFVYNAIKQRQSMAIPLQRLDLERKRKSFLNSDIPSKLSKPDGTLIDKYLPISQVTAIDETAPGPTMPKRKRSHLDE